MAIIKRGRPTPLLADEDFIKLFEEIGAAGMERRGLAAQRDIYDRRRRIERHLGRSLNSPNRDRAISPVVAHPQRVTMDVLNGVVLIGSDAHIWPGPLTTAMRAFIKFARDMKPRGLILNGDVLDFPQISRHPMNWEERPTVADEIDAARKVLEQIEDAVPRNCKLAWDLGNHDARLEVRIATAAPELAKLKGVHLKDHFSPRWLPCWSVWINGGSPGGVVVKHRFKGGQGATRANTLNAGMSMVTGHLHSANVRGLTDYNGTRWGVDTGCLAEPRAEAFSYTEDAPLDWRSGFAVLTFKDGVLLQPELVLVYDKNSVQFRGQIIEVPHEAPAKPAPNPANARRRKPRRLSRRTAK